MSLPRALHPGAWWIWALGLAVAASRTTNPFLLALALAVAGLVVSARRGQSPWSRAFHLYLWLGGFIVAVRVLLHILVGVKLGTYVVLPLPTLQLPQWAAGIDLLGPVRLEGLLAAAAEGARLATIIACLGAANALADPKRLLRATPGALYDIGTAVVIAITVAPQLADSLRRVTRARALRGDASRGIRAIPRLALPVLSDTLDRSLLLAASMDARGYGVRRPVARGVRAAASAMMLGGLLLTVIGMYAVLAGSGTPSGLGVPGLLLGLIGMVAGIWLGGRSALRTTYRPDPWLGPEWLTAASGVVAAAAMIATGQADPDALTLPLTPLAVPALPLVAVAGLLAAAAPAYLTPRPPAASRRPLGTRQTPAEVGR